jgi:hypothetical protein
MANSYRVRHEAIQRPPNLRERPLSTEPPGGIFRPFTPGQQRKHSCCYGGNREGHLIRQVDTLASGPQGGRRLHAAPEFMQRSQGWFRGQHVTRPLNPLRNNLFTPASYQVMSPKNFFLPVCYPLP